MAKVIVLITLLVQLYCMPIRISGQSPCPEYFSYITDFTTDEVLGQIVIPSAPKNRALHIKVALSIAVALPTSYVGKLELAQSKEESVEAVQRGLPLLYRIHFPLHRPIPLLTGIWFNNEQYCSGPRAMGHIVTSIMLEHNLYPPNIPLSQSSIPNASPMFPFRPDIFWQQPTIGPVYSTSNRPTVQRPITQRPITIQRPKKKPATPRPTTTVGLSDGQRNECGRTAQTSDINLLISKGVKTSPGQWPWLVAIFLVKIEFEFQCAGSILTNRHVITAAHCFKLDVQDNVNIPPSAMLVSLGRYRLREWYEKGSVNREIASYTIHPDYTHQGTGDSDIAILVLRTSVEFSPTIKPICLWSGPTILQSVVNKPGYVVGWGRDELGNPYLAEPRMAKAPIVSQEECLWSDQRFVSFTSNRTLCAGLRDGSGPCNGDSGSGLVLYEAGRYQLRGIVSRSLFDSNQMTCDLTQYVVFVDVAKYLSWIQQQILST
ncbi:hypothetical protein DMN91_000272 [Ooceraea biroi]|uniref:Serine protease gd n=1 Tax=Ooceraea biroi TaxID=2015173 RepID=A0A026WG55_OOCBI|nr:serine protease gd [Ooceraea biroi]XP_026830836.1 serine protease gd [Ooceraea biroi]EZA54024.1 Serine protease gd [Ooceraea biroi]RLU26476.1 hypothetical protein DMN91_000272 [Ooceraea biroi]